MNMFDQLNSFFRVGNTISQSSNTQSDDVLKTKSALAQTGDYQVPDFGITDIPDMGMIDGLKKFQQNNGLKVDGVMKPNGPTEAKLGETLSNQGITNNDLLEAAKLKLKPKASKIDLLTGLPEVKMPKLKKPTAKMWKQVAQRQKPKTAVLPEGKTVQQRITSMMQDKRYQDKQDTRLKDHIAQQFKKAFPGQVSYDPIGKMEQPQAAILPEEVEPFDPDGELNNKGNQRISTTEFSERSFSQSDEQNPEKENVEEDGDVVVAGGDDDDGKCDQKQADYKARKDEYDSYENAITTLDGAIEDLENDIEDYKGKEPSFFDYECRKRTAEFIRLVEAATIIFGRGKAVSKLLKLKLEWLTIKACSDSKAETRKRQFIEDMESALDGLISTRDDIDDALPDKETEVNDALDALGDCQDNA